MLKIIPELLHIISIDMLEITGDGCIGTLFPEELSNFVKHSDLSEEGVDS